MTPSLISTDEYEEVLPYSAPRDIWLRERQKGIGGSDAPAVAGLDQFSSRLRVYLDKTGRAPERRDTPSMAFGRRIEPVIREWFTEVTGIGVSLHGLLRNRENPWQQYSPDAFTDDGGLLEIKAVRSPYMAREWEGDHVSDRAAIQGQHGLRVTAKTHVWYAALVGVELVVRREYRDDTLISDLTAIEDDFWHGHVVAQVPPPLGHAADPELVRLLHPLASPGEAVDLDEDGAAALAEYRALGEQIKTLDALRDAAQARVCAALGDAEFGFIDEKQAVSWRNTGPFSAKSLHAERPDLYDAYQRTVTEFDKERFAKDHPHTYTAYRSRRFAPSTRK